MFLWKTNVTLLLAELFLTSNNLDHGSKTTLGCSEMTKSSDHIVKTCFHYYWIPAHSWWRIFNKDGHAIVDDYIIQFHFSALRGPQCSVKPGNTSGALDLEILKKSPGYFFTSGSPIVYLLHAWDRRHKQRMIHPFQRPQTKPWPL